MLLLTIPGPSAWAGSLIVDQFYLPSTGFDHSFFDSIQLGGPIGQEFRPALSSVGFVEIFTASPAGGPGEVSVNLAVQIRQGSIGGPILGTSFLVHVETPYFQLTQFEFAADIPVIPGDLYVAEITAAGDNWSAGSSDVPPLYAPGQFILEGIPREGRDLRFLEGVVIPEPATWLLLGTGLAGLIAWGRRIQH